MSFEIILPIITLLLGFFLNELSYVFRSSREHRQEIGLIISFLLEIRHQLKTLKFISVELKKYIHYLPEFEVHLRNYLVNFFPQSEDFSKNFNESINVVSKFNPLLAFRVRSQDQFIPAMQKLRNLALTETSSILIFIEMDNLISSKYVQFIEDMLFELAKVHGIKTKRLIKNNLSKEHVIPEEFKDIMILINERNSKT